MSDKKSICIDKGAEIGYADCVDMDWNYEISKNIKCKIEIGIKFAMEDKMQF